MNHEEIISRVIRQMDAQERIGCCELPNRRKIVEIISDVQTFMFPAFSQEECLSERMLLEKIYWELTHQIRRALKFAGRTEMDPEAAADAFLKEIPNIYAMLLKDVEALYEGDPAAGSREEVILAYPGFFAILVYRIAHVLYEMKVPILPRIMTEFVHQKTGVDIHAGAKIGEYFFIDHGTGIVVGETTDIGDHVKLYQGVTLGALSPRAGHNSLPGKRHPTVGNDVTIYSGASILGGQTVIGDHSVVGGNAFLTGSVDDNTRVVIQAPETIFKNAKPQK